MVTHKHHIVPRHAGGTDDKWNLIEVSVGLHALLHKIRYDQYGEEYDNIAYLGLSGMMGKEELIRAAQVAGGKSHIASGHLASISSKGGKSAVASGQLASIRSKAGKATAGKLWWHNGVVGKRSATRPDETFVAGRLPRKENKNG